MSHDPFECWSCKYKNEHEKNYCARCGAPRVKPEEPKPQDKQEKKEEKND